MDTEILEGLISNLKHRKIDLATDQSVSVNYGKEKVNKILPHRPPIDLINSITAVDLVNQAIEVTSFIKESNPVFRGHFPGFPVYPGIFLIESMGQAGLCLAYFVKNSRDFIGPESSPVACLFTKVHHAAFMETVKPGMALILRSRIIEQDDYTGIVASQVIVGGKIFATAVLEVCFL